MLSAKMRSSTRRTTRSFASWSNFLGMFQIFPSTQTEQNLGHFSLSYPSSHSFHLKCLKWKSSIMVALPKLGIIFILSEGSLCRCKHQP